MPLPCWSRQKKILRASSWCRAQAGMVWEWLYPKRGKKQMQGPGRIKEPTGRVDKGKHGGTWMPRSLNKVGPPQEEAWGMTGSEGKRQC